MILNDLRTGDIAGIKSTCASRSDKFELWKNEIAQLIADEIYKGEDLPWATRDDGSVIT